MPIMPVIHLGACSVAIKFQAIITSVSIALLLFGCQSHPAYSPEESDKLIAKIYAGEHLADEDYNIIMSQLDGMLYVVCNKAQLLVDSGYKRTEVRTYLKRDSDYRAIYRQSGVLDSVMLEYLQSPDAEPKLRTRYNELQLRYANRFMKLGLN